MQVLWGMGGMLFILAIAFLFSSNRRAIRPRTVLGALAIQVAFAVIVLYWEPGRTALETLARGVQAVIGASEDGIEFLFGGVLEGEGVGFIFAFQVLPVIIFFASLTAVLYHLHILQWVVRLLGGAVQWLLGTSRAESMSATANIFVGQTEAPLVVRPFVEKMTRSELFAVMTGGLASVAGSVLVGYALLGARLEYLIAAAFMAAPGGLLMAKMLMPETETPLTASGEAVAEVDEVVAGEAPAGTEKPRNVIDAAAVGALDGLRLALNVGAMLIAFISLIALINLILGAAGGLFGYGELTFQLILGYVFAPVMFVIGVPWSEAIEAGSFLGQKLVLNEFVAFVEFGPRADEFSDKAEAIITFALTGFANFGSIAILIGGLGGIAPSRRSEIAQLGLRAVLAGTLANLMSATIAGVLIG
ncbi:NupC/NupG family nucleoside CNT transporter [Rubrobacter taiwanensis]|jgi:CNT family concentrative nucleoside transporter|uniref:Nucleoside permease n=1 Tax=Rubrobacter taiwanensis TaxID=185139 RepID=A0A4R1BFQ3_9ACTN|nr:NupC/NupG family nucleoside CNT transporter [Rubrobacter taiwanensis]TCJ16026.1 NupC/NupG family nucleoside CNT transporter [Rubrobacter taiwanensis]